MNFAVGLLLFTALCAFIAILRGIANARRSRRGIEDGLAAEERPAVRWPSGTRPVRWVDADDLARLMEMEPDLILVRLMETGSIESTLGLPREMEVKFDELEGSLRWVPNRVKLVIYRPGGIYLELAQRLMRLVQGHEVYLLRDSEIRLREVLRQSLAKSV